MPLCPWGAALSLALAPACGSPSAPPQIVAPPPIVASAAPDPPPVETRVSVAIEPTDGGGRVVPAGERGAPRIHSGKALVLDCRGSLRLWPFARGAAHPGFGPPPVPSDLDPGAEWPARMLSGDRATFVTWDDATFLRWDVATGARRETRTRGRFLSMSRDASIVALPLPRGSGVMVRRADTDAELGRVRLPSNATSTLSPDGRWLLAVEVGVPTDQRLAERIDTASMFEVRTGRRAWSRRSLLNTADYVFSDDGRTLTVFDEAMGLGSPDPFRRWEVPSGREAPRPATGSVYGWAVSPDGSALLTRGDGTGPTLWDLATGQARSRSDVPGAGDFKFDDGGRLALQAAPAQSLTIYALDPLRVVRTVDLGREGIGYTGRARFVRGGRAVALDGDGVVWLVRVRDGALLRLDVFEVISGLGERSCTAVASTREGMLDGDEEALGFVRLDVRRGDVTTAVHRGADLVAHRRRDLLVDFLSDTPP